MTFEDKIKTYVNTKLIERGFYNHIYDYNNIINHLISKEFKINIRKIRKDIIICELIKTETYYNILSSTIVNSILVYYESNFPLKDVDKWIEEIFTISEFITFIRNKKIKQITNNLNKPLIS